MHQYSVISYKTIETHRKINFIFNILLPICLLLFVKANPITIAICFILYDFLSILIEKIILKSLDKDPKSLKKAKEMKDKYSKFLEQSRRKPPNNSKKEQEVYDYNFFVERKINSLETYIRAEEINLRENEKKSYIPTEFENIKNNIKDLKEFYSKTKDENTLNILTCCNEIISIIDKNPDYEESIINNTFNIYLSEFIKITKEYYQSNTLKENNSQKVELLYEVFFEYLNSIRNRIKGDKRDKFDVNIDVLISSVQQETKREDK